MNTLTFLLSTVIELYTMVLLLRIWMQWAHCDFYNPFSQFVVKVTQPIIGPLRRVIPAMGPIDRPRCWLPIFSVSLKPSCCLKW